MRLFKFTFYGFAFFIGLCIAFCANTNYDNQSYPATPLSSKIKAVEIEMPQSLVQQGKALFKVNCASCHNKNMIDDMTGPALSGVLDRWNGREDLLKEWIRNSSKVIESGDPYAVDLYRKWNKSVMTSFPNLNDQEIEAILVYVER